MRPTARSLLLASALALPCCGGFFTTDVTREESVSDASIHSLPYTTLDGKASTLADFRGKAVLLVNTASECGFTPQYAGLEQLQEEYSSRGFTVLGFPCNDFGGQEPLDADGIANFCSSKFGVTFPLTEKVVVKAGDGQSPVYAFLGKATGKLPGWNFCKYVIDADGKPTAFFPSNVAPDAAELRAAIESVLPQ